MSEYLLDIDVVFDGDDLLETAERSTLLPEFDLENYALQAMRPEDDYGDRPTLEIPQEELIVLVAKSTPPMSGVDLEPFRLSAPYSERISSARAFSLATRWAPDR